MLKMAPSFWQTSSPIPSYTNGCLVSWRGFTVTSCSRQPRWQSWLPISWHLNGRKHRQLSSNLITGDHPTKIILAQVKEKDQNDTGFLARRVSCRIYTSSTNMLLKATSASFS